MGLFAFLMLLLLIAVSAAVQEPGFFSWAYWQEGGAGTSRSEVVRNLGLLAAAIIGLGVGSWRAFTAYLQTQASQKQANIAEQGHFTERFSKAVEQLGDVELPVRLGGIYALWRLVQESSVPDFTSVMDIFCAFVRKPPHPSQEFEASAEGKALPVDGGRPKTTALHTRRPDVQALLYLVVKRAAPWRSCLPGYKLDFSNADLVGADLFGADLSNAELWNANLRGAVLREANLKNALLYSANLTGAEFFDANLEGAELANADLTKARLEKAKNLTQRQVSSAVCNPAIPPSLPEELTPPKRRPEPACA